MSQPSSGRSARRPRVNGASPGAPVGGRSFTVPGGPSGREQPRQFGYVELDAGHVVRLGVLYARRGIDPQDVPALMGLAMVGLGGVLTEVLGDVAFALAPVDRGTARQMLESLRTAAVLHGVRGKPAVDIDAAAEAIAAISTLAVAHPEISELEVNPLLVTTTGATGLDARIVLTEPTTTTTTTD